MAKVESYTSSYIDELLASTSSALTDLINDKADLVDGFVPHSQLPKSISLGIENLDTIQATSTWNQDLSANATLERNYPVSVAGLLEVHVHDATNDFIYQTYRTFGNDNRMFIRAFYSNVWSQWREVGTLTLIPGEVNRREISYTAAMALGNTRPGLSTDVWDITEAPDHTSWPEWSGPKDVLWVDGAPVIP